MIPLMRVTAVILVLCSFGLAALFHHISGPRTVGHPVRTPDGVEMRIMQQCNWGGEPFTTRFVFRKAGGGWGGFCVGHQDWYWANCRARLETNAHVAMFYRGTNILLAFDWVEETCWRPQRGAVTGPQFRLPPGWSPRGEDRW